MTNTHQQTDEEIFTAALAFKSVEEQNRFVAMTVAGDNPQRDRVLSLLASHRKLKKVDTTFVLDRPEEVCNELMMGDEVTIGEQVGPYRIMQLLGEGGMGLVYQAEQLTPIRRRVALKLLKPGMDSQKVLARFELERQALAGMEHPGITQILDAGLADSGRPYFVMELVKGISITEYCRTHQLQAMDCIQLMIDVCSAIQHAHQRGIIHRDIKPSNILVAQSDRGPVPKVIDFGIAKLINDSMGNGDHFTLHGEMIGTPEYMSPEQALSSAEGVDTRTDVYSLGVLLYELLTGETPLAGVHADVGLARLRQLFRDSKMELPSKRVARLRVASTSSGTTSSSDDSTPEKFLRGEVDCIVMKALARDPNDRYQSVSELKRDLERFVVGLPIEAAPPSVFYQLKKLIKRHRVIASVASLAFLVVAISSAMAILFGVVANDRLKEVLKMQSDLEIERDRAVDAERKARLLAQSYLIPFVFDKAFRRFCIEHWDELVQVNPKLKTLSIPKENELLHPDVQQTIADSNLVDIDPRIVIFDDERWLAKVLSDISKQDVGNWMLFGPQPVMVSESVSVGPTSSPSEESNVQEAKPLPLEAGAEAVAIFPSERKRSINFRSPTGRSTLEFFLKRFVRSIRNYRSLQLRKIALDFVKSKCNNRILLYLIFARAFVSARAIPN